MARRASKYDVVREVWKGVAVPSILYSVDMMVWSKRDVDKLKECQNKIARVALGAPRYASVEELRGDMEYSLFSEQMMKATKKYKVRLGRMDEDRWVRRIHMWSLTGSR